MNGMFKSNYTLRISAAVGAIFKHNICARCRCHTTRRIDDLTATVQYLGRQIEWARTNGHPAWHLYETGHRLWRHESRDYSGRRRRKSAVRMSITSRPVAITVSPHVDAGGPAFCYKRGVLSRSRPGLTSSANGTVFCFTVFVGVISCFCCGRQN